MARNVEIKARVSDLTAIAAAVKALSADLPQTIEQTDVFFPTREGRLKLRILSLARGELIFYQRPDQTGPKTSTYSISATNEPFTLRAVLSAAYGEDIVVRKVRTLFMLGRTRVHLDRVDNLGDFLELEVVLKGEDQIAAGIEEAYAIMNKLGIREADLIDGAYADLLRSRA
ncbi:class IV adenylate cyclase [Brucella sp. IR073]|uniref:class IV adenylate cyclase n=1 Tax=unclassified Brucella TaxID=2632610 RepID=UPI003B987673